ncbi:hypothetical protein PYCCODRAFT_1152802 [Trametes coccinea BRFM310]|uniref:Uncharacterized protein n=1 Tax=Trametes coccinea (strain BRFM310) TaxID=1353009 RepID=A0A1Y2IZB8_TRAC3|nr:hypothetical protein PYCCODRAFT_1152802 [Trametes coccinea BRFM310]
MIASVGRRVLGRPRPAAIMWESVQSQTRLALRRRGQIEGFTEGQVDGDAISELVWRRNCDSQRCATVAPLLSEELVVLRVRSQGPPRFSNEFRDTSLLSAGWKTNTPLKRVGRRARDDDGGQTRAGGSGYETTRPGRLLVPTSKRVQQAANVADRLTRSSKVQNFNPATQEI